MEELDSISTSDLQYYKSVIADTDRLRKRLWLWATISFLYVFSGLTLEFNEGTITIELLGISVKGMTEVLLTNVLFVLTLYSAVAYFWNFFLKCRGLKRGFVKSLWLLRQSFFKAGSFSSGFEGMKPVKIDSYTRGILSQFGKSRFVIVLEFTVIPLYFPAMLSFVAMMSIVCEKFF